MEFFKYNCSHRQQCGRLSGICNFFNNRNIHHTDSATGISGSTTLTVTAAQLVSIATTPANPAIAKGTTKQFIATGAYTDSTTQDLTTSVTWSSSDTGTATISNAAGSSGLATSVAVGSTTIKATDPVSNINGSTMMTVTAANIVSIALSPVNPSIAKGPTQQFSATGTYTDGTTQNLTTSVTWSSSNTGIVSISNAVGSKGLATPIAVGSTIITATDPSSSISNTTTLSVTAATLISVTVTPSNPSTPNGTTQQFIATGTYTDSTTKDLTTSVTWTTSNTGIAAISNAAGSNGLATSIAPGSATITASSGSISGSTSITVIAAQLVSISVTPANTIITKGTTQQFTATGTYTDGTTQNLTTSVTWSSSNTGVATISNGLATAIATGSTTVTATSGNISASTSIAATYANRAYVTNGDSNTVSVIDTTINTVVATIGIRSYPTGIAVNPITNKAYITALNGGGVGVFDAATNTVTAYIIMDPNFKTE